MRINVLLAITASSFLALSSLTGPAVAEGLFPSKKSSKRTPPPPPPQPYQKEQFDIAEPRTWTPYSHFYVGITGGVGFGELETHRFRDTDRTFPFGAYAGYMVHPSPTWAFGAEVDYMRTGFKVSDHDERTAKSLWNSSLRARLGVYPLKDVPLMPYVTAGLAYADNGKGMGGVYGGGLEWELSKRMAARAEVLRYQFDGLDQDTTIARVGLSFSLTP